MKNVTPPTGRYVGINWASVWNSGVGDLRFWMIPGLGWLALVFFLTDTSISIGYLTTFSTLSDKGFGYKIVAVILGIGVGFLVHFGMHRVVAKCRGWVLKGFGLFATLCAFLFSLFFAVAFFQGVWQLDLQNEAEMSTRASGMRDVAASERSTEVEEAAVLRTGTALEAASTRRQEAEALRVELAGLPAGRYDPRTAEIQTIIGAVPDGIKYNETTNAMAAFASTAAEEERAADAAYQSANAALLAKQALLVTAVERELGAALLETEQTYLRSMRSWAEGRLGVTYEDDPVAVQAESERLANIAGSSTAALVTILSFFFGLFRFMIKDPQNEDDDAFVVHHRPARGPAPAGLPKPNPNVIPGMGGEQVAWPSQGEAYIADDAPIQPGETRSAARERLRRAEEKLAAVMAGEEDDDDIYAEEKAKATEALAAEVRRQKHEREMSAIRRQIDEIASKPAPSVTPSSRPYGTPPTLSSDIDPGVLDSITAINERNMERLRVELRALQVEHNTALSPRAREKIERRINAIRAEIADISNDQLRLGHVRAEG